MESLILLCIGFIGYLFYRVNRQKNQLTVLHIQIQKLQQQFSQLQKTVLAQAVKPAIIENEKLEAEQADEPDVTSDIASPLKTHVEPVINQHNQQAHPTAIEKALVDATTWIKNYFSQGNQIVRVGIIILFLGLSFLAKYSIEHSLISIEVRMIAILFFAIAILGVGWHLRIKNPAYGLVMQGGGIGMGYLAIFSSFKLYQLLPAELAFPLLIIFSVMAIGLAIIQDSRALAVTAITGGFAAPILTSTGAGSHIALFAYYLVLNGAIFSVAWFKSWRLLNVIGFLFTFIIGTVWGILQYRSGYFYSTEPFLIAFFILYVVISILFSIKQKPELKGYVDGTLVFGVPMVGFGLQSALVSAMEYGLACSSAALAAFYLGLTYLLKKQHNPNLTVMSQAMLALAVIFATLTLPFALDGRWSAASWAIEGAGFIWIALRQQRDILKYVGFALQLLGGLLFLIDYPYYGGNIIFFNAEFMGIAIISLSALFSTYLLHNNIKNDFEKTDKEKSIMQSISRCFNLFSAPLLLILGIVWWYVGGLNQIENYTSQHYELIFNVLFLSVSAMAWLYAGIKFQWREVRFFPWLLLLPLILCAFLTQLNSHFSDYYGFIIWPIALAVLFSALYFSEKKNYSLLKPIALHSMSYLLTVGIIASEVAWQFDYLNLAMSWIGSGIIAVLLIALTLIQRQKFWPFNNHLIAYQHIAAVIIIGLMFIWMIVFNIFWILPPRPLPFIPLLNPIDIFQLLSVIAIWQWYQANKTEKFISRILDQSWESISLKYALCASFLFLWFNILLLKTIHIVSQFTSITNIPYAFEYLFQSAIVQTSISIIWTLVGLVVMMRASKFERRNMWMAGASLIAIVVAKLFLLDLSEQETIERIISFIVVGLLLLVIGYFSPVPPKKEIAEHD